jgi:hypothetical protein
MASWMEAWCRIGLGRSLIREEESGARLRGVIELLHLPARFGTEHPNLAGVALADAAVTMAELGDVEAARSLKDELIAKFPNHPVLAWDPLAKISASAARRPDLRSGSGHGSGSGGAGRAAGTSYPSNRASHAPIEKGPA